MLIIVSVPGWYLPVILVWSLGRCSLLVIIVSVPGWYLPVILAWSLG